MSSLNPSEKAFRRGYHHGYTKAIEDVLSGNDPTECRSFSDHELYSWRFQICAYAESVDGQIPPAVCVRSVSVDSPA